MVKNQAEIYALPDPILNKCSLEWEEHKFPDEECTKLFPHSNVFIWHLKTSEVFSVRAEDPEILSLVATEIMAFLKCLKEVATWSANTASDSLEIGENTWALSGS